MTLLDRALSALYLEVPELVARDMGKIVRDAVAEAHSSGIAQGREEAAKWHDAQGARLTKLRAAAICSHEEAAAVIRALGEKPA